MFSKVSISVLAVLGLVFASPILLAQGSAPKFKAIPGGESSGGGGDLVARFITAMTEVIDRIDSMDQDTVEVAVLRKALENVKVVVAEELVNPRTNQPIAENYLDAYGSLGLIQIKPIWKDYLKANADGDYDAQIAHELLRAAGINDDGYKYSILELQLNRPRSRPREPGLSCVEVVVSKFGERLRGTFGDTTGDIDRSSLWPYEAGNPFKGHAIRLTAHGKRGAGYRIEVVRQYAIQDDPGSPYTIEEATYRGSLESGMILRVGMDKDRAYQISCQLN